MPTVHIGIGSNIGDRASNCLDALRMLQQNGVEVLKRASLHETKPWGVEDQPMFVNTAAEIRTDLSPSDLLGLLKKIEAEMGRTKTLHWGPRVIDLDILFYDDLVVDEPDLVIPHPFLHERDFVLAPLSEIAPQKKHPVLLRTVEELLRIIRKHGRFHI